MPNLDTVSSNKLSITAFLDSAFTRPLRPLPNRMTAAYNPQSLSIKQDIKFESEQGASTSGAKPDFYASGSRKLSVTLSFVGVDFGPYGRTAARRPLPRQDVKKELELFERLCQRINGTSHEPTFVRLDWGWGGLRSTFEARLEGYEVKYIVFDRTGKLLVAEVKASFVEAVHPSKQRARQRLSSPDLTHRHLVLAGENLPMLCLRYYGTTDPYLQVAAFNQLDSIRALTPGETLFFPPLNSAGGQD
jgi:hypothetical protein